ncbi:DivIVA domain-containing protein [Falseniella ignava]|nr:DivIVA domain-containing protein [Falseniella ignava]
MNRKGDSMAITPNEILTKEFDSRFRGYDANQVNDFLDMIVADYDQLIVESERLKEQLAQAHEKNAYFAQLQESLNSSILVAQEAAERLKQNARKEAELILFEAEREADLIIDRASTTAKDIVKESDVLRRSSKSYRAKLEQIIREQLAEVTSSEYHRLFDEELDTTYDDEHLKEANQRAIDRVDYLEQQDPEGFNQINEIAEQIKEDQQTELYNFEDVAVDPAQEVATKLQEEYSQEHDDEDLLGETIQINPKN